MADEPCRLLPLEEEIEGDREGTADFIFSRIGESVPLKPSDSSFDLEDPPKQPLAVSERYRALFLAHSEGFLVAKTKDVFELAKKIKETGKGPCVQESCVVDVQIGRVSILALSENLSTLAATVGGDIHFFSVPLLLDKEQEASFSCSLDKSGSVKDFKWQNNVEKSFIVLTDHGSLYHGYLDVQPKDVMDNVDAVDLSREGDFIAVARENTLSILSSDFREQLRMSLLFQTWPIDSNCSIRVDSIKWLRDDSIIIGCFRVNEDGNEDGYLVQIITSMEQKFTEISSKLAVFSFPDLFDGFSDDILPIGSGPFMLASYLDFWELTLASSRKNIDQHILLLKWSMDENRREVVSLDFKNDKYTPRIDLQENDDDNLVLGFAVDTTSLYEKVKIEVDSEIKELSPRCVLLCLTAEGKVIMYHAARLSEPSDLHTSLPPDANNYVNKGLSTHSSSDVELLSTTSRLKDDVKSAISGRDMKILENVHTVEVGEGKISTGKKAQDSASSQLGLFTGKIPNLNQPSLESPPIQGSGLALRSDSRTCTQKLSMSSAEKDLHSTSFGYISSEASSDMRQGSTKSTIKNGEASKAIVGATNVGGASFGSQSTIKLFGTDGFNTKSSTSSRSVLSDAQAKALNNIFSTELPSSGKPFSLKGSNIEPPPLKFSLNKATQDEGHATYGPRAGNAEPLPATRGYPSVSPEGSVPGKSLYSKAQPLHGDIRTSRYRQMPDSEPELSKQFYNVKDMARELDNLLSFIEREGGFKDECTVFQERSLLALENGLENLAKNSQMCRKKIEEQLMEIQQLQNKMLQVSARQVYMEGIVKQASNVKYWDIWNRQKLSPEFEVKRQRILDAKQSLTNQLIELERHFNTLEINRFGESGRITTGRRSSRSSLEPSRQIQSLHSVYNTLNSQLAAAEQLSECLSKHMAALKINSPSAQRQNVRKELFESIGLAHETNVFQSPDPKRPGFTPDSASRILSSTFNDTKEYPLRITSSALKTFEPETARRRRDSLDRSWVTFEPPKTTVKRMLKEESSGISVDKPFRKAKETFDSQMEALAIIQQKKSETSSPSYLESSKNDFQSHRDLLNRGAQEKPSGETFEVQSNSVFQWAKNPSGHPPASNSHQMQVVQTTKKHMSSLMASSPSKLSNAQTSRQDNFGSSDMSSSEASGMGKSVPSSKMIPNMQIETSIPIQTSLKFSSTSSPLKTRLTAEAIDHASKHLNLKTGEDARASSGSMKQLTDSLESFSSIRNERKISSLSSTPTTTFGLNESTTQSDRVMAKYQSTESASLMASQPKVSVSIPSFSSAFPASINSASVSASATPSLESTLFNATAVGGLPFASKPLVEANSQAVSVSLSTSGASSHSLLSSSSFTSSPSLASPSMSPIDFRGSSETNQTALISASTSAASSQSLLFSSSLPFSQSQNSLFSSSITSSSSASISSPSHENLANSRSEPDPSEVSAIEGSLHLGKVSSEVEPTTLESPASEHVESASKDVASLLPANSGSVFLMPNPQPELPSATPPLSTATDTGKDEGLDPISPQEDEMEEEAPDTTVLNLGSLGGFGLGSTPPSSVPKLNPFGGSVLTANSSAASSPLSFAGSPGELFRPASFSLPSAQPVQPSQPKTSGPFSSGVGGGFSGFGQPAQLGAGNQALGSVLGAFGQSRQLGTGMQGFGFASSGGISTGGFSAAASGGGFSGAATGGGFTSVSPSGGGFAGAATGGGFASIASGGGGFAGAAASKGFAAAASSGGGGGGFAAAASVGGGFAGAVQGGGGGGFTSGSYGAFGSNQGGGFSAFSGSGASGAGRPPAELFTQMRK